MKLALRAQDLVPRTMEARGRQGWAATQASTHTPSVLKLRAALPPVRTAS